MRTLFYLSSKTLSGLGSTVWLYMHLLEKFSGPFGNNRLAGFLIN